MKGMLRGLICALLLACSAATGWATVLGIGNDTVTGAIPGYTGGYGTVTITGNTVVFSGYQDVLYNGNTYDFLFNDVAMNVDGSFVLSNFSPTSFQYEPPPPNTMDGFGTFNLRVGNTTNNGGSGATSVISFDSTNVNLIDNLLGYNLAAHVYIFENGGTDAIATGYVANGETPPVPEPATLLLLGSGFLGLAIYGKRRRNA